MSLPKTTAVEETVKIDDLRPHLGNLNWQLRRLGLGVAVVTDEDGCVAHVTMGFGAAAAWTVTCDGCGEKYDPGRAANPTCPSCGLEVAQEKVITQRSR